MCFENAVCADDPKHNAIAQLEVIKELQTVWSDNAVSCTITYTIDELPSIKEWLRRNYNDYIKSVSFLLHSGHGFKQAPLEPITKERYLELMERCTPITSIAGICYKEEDLSVLTEADPECPNGVCPIR